MIHSHIKLVAIFLWPLLLAVCGDKCINTLPNVSTLEVQRPSLSLEYYQLRLFPNLTFSCSGSIVGWSMITPKHRRVGGLPILGIWTRISEENGIYLQKYSALLRPCLRKVIDADAGLFLHENVLEQPLEFRRGDILGMLLRRTQIARFIPYFMSKQSFVSTFRKTLGSPINDTESINGEKDNNIPLLSLVTCAKGEDSQKCLARATSCTANVSPTSPVSPTSTVINNYDGAQSENSATPVLLITAAVSVPMGLLLLILVTVVVALLVYVWIVKKRAQIIVTNSLEPEPYAEPIKLPPSPLPSTQSRAPLPPIPNRQPYPAYAVLNGPAPSPPPPYGTEHQQQRLESQTIESPKYETIDDFNKTHVLQHEAVNEEEEKDD